MSLNLFEMQEWMYKDKAWVAEKVQMGFKEWTLIEIERH